GLGEDGASSWGGELLRVRPEASQRLGALRPLPQPGGDRAAREPWRMGAAALHILGRPNEIAERFEGRGDVGLLAAMLERRVNAPESSSAGRLFDAACGLLNVTPVATHEAEAAMALEALVTKPRVLEGGWRIEANNTLDFSPLLGALTEMTPPEGADLFHGTLAAGLADWAARAAAPTDAAVAVSGGCIQNAILRRELTARLTDASLKVLYPKDAPANDGGLSLGQVYVAAARVRTDAKEV
ncbi:MAG: hypothetical protein AAGL49_02815, partial [Pseudomonadota bacterium]